MSEGLRVAIAGASGFVGRASVLNGQLGAVDRWSRSRGTLLT